MTSPPAAVVDALNSLLEAEQGSVFRFMGEGSPYLSRATADVRRPLQEMVEANKRHVAALGSTIQRLGGFPAPRPVRAEEQYLAFLSLKFLLPKLVHEKNLAIRRLENAIAGERAAPATPPEVLELLNAHLAELQAELTSLEQATAHGSNHLSP